MWKGEVAVMGMDYELLCCEQLIHSGKAVYLLLSIWFFFSFFSFEM